jgi:hypothetical protein
MVNQREVFAEQIVRYDGAYAHTASKHTVGPAQPSSTQTDGKSKS